MKTEEIKKSANYFTELSRRFRREGINCTAPKDDRLPVLLDGQEIGIVTPGGDMRVRKEFIDEPDANDLYGHLAARRIRVQPHTLSTAWCVPVQVWQREV